MKKIVFYVIDNGVDGTGKEEILYAHFDEECLDSMLTMDSAKQWRTKGERIVDIESAKAEAMSKLNGIDRLILGLPSWLNERIEKENKLKEL